MTSLVKIRGRYFLDGVWLKNEPHGCYKCHEKSCPFGVRVSFNRDGGPVQPTVDKILFPVHCHAFPDNRRLVNRDFVQRELDLIEQGGPESESLKQKHYGWLLDAQKQCKEIIESLDEKTGFDKYSVKHPEATGSELRDFTGKKMTKKAASMAQKRAMQKAGMVTTIAELLEAKKHHLLANDGEDILVFGDKATVPYMSTTPLILADGTFSCVLPGYTQLYILHVIVANNVAVPALFCLVRGKRKQTYDKLLELVEGIAEADATTFLKRPVTLMCDFEGGFIKAVQQHYASVKVKCCLFRFTQNVRKAATPVLTKVKDAAGETAEAVTLTEKTKRRFMMLPLLPEELISPEVVRLVLDEGKAGAPDGLKDAFDGLAKKVLRTYVGTPRRDGRPPRPSFPPVLWSVSGQSIRTNNSAESLHSAINKKTKGMLSLRRFLNLLEEEMAKARDRVAAGCRPESRPAVHDKNKALAAQLDSLVHGRQGALEFLDNCGLILSMKKLEKVRRFSPREVFRLPDSQWSLANRNMLDQAARNLYFRLHPTGQFSDGEILGNVTEWAFQDLPPSEVPNEDADQSDLSLV